MLPLLATVASLALAAGATSPAGSPAGTGTGTGTGAGAERLRRTDLPLALVLSGGVSLGAYEAGVSWAVVRFSQAAGVERSGHDPGAPRLVAVTGASAGSINALLSAAAWCSDPADGDVEHNLFREVWLPVGADGLLPEEASGYEPGDSLLSTRPLLEAIDRFGARLAAAAAGRRLRPGCRLPLGLTVTRARAAEHEVAGLTVRTQRFALPWRLEVGADGLASVFPQPLGGGEVRLDVIDAARADPSGVASGALSWPQVAQGVLASAAFPVAFRARELCECSARCPAAHQVRSGSCEGPRGRLGGLRCPARSPDGEPLALCAHPYVDGGIFDNTPVGLGVELAQALFDPQPLQPVTYVYIDPDVRRLLPAQGSTAPLPSPRVAGQNLEATARLLGELVATSRNQDLSRTLQGGAWTATTRRLLYDAAAAVVTFSAAEARLARAAGADVAAEVELPRAVPDAAVRDALGRALFRCGLDRREGPASCARALAEAAAGRAAPASPLSDDELVGTAEAFGRASREHLHRTVSGAPRDPATFADELRIGAAAMLFFADETPRVARGGLPDARLRQLRAALLDIVQLGRAFAEDAARRANGRVLAELERLAADPALRPLARRAADAIAASPDLLFVPSDLEPVLDAADLAGAGGEAAGALRALVAAGPVLQAEIVRLNRLARAADALQQRRTERTLHLSSRFAPIAGSQLGNFGAFLDRPLREYDYAAGIYDASHAIAVGLCELAAVPGAPVPLRDVATPGALDLAAPETQRCLGAALHAVRAGLDVDRSGSAALVFRALARAELGATLGGDAAAELAAEPTWAWLAAPVPPPDPAVAIVAEALLSARVPCAPEAETRCIRELTFEELLDALRVRGYRPAEASMAVLLQDPDLWARRTGQKLLDRSLERERSTPGSSDVAPGVLLAHGVGEMWLRRPSGAGPFPRLELDPSTIPARSLSPSLLPRRLLAHLVPYRLDLDVARGGVAVSWFDPALWLGRRVSIVAQLTPLAYAPRKDRVTSSAALLPTVHLGGLAVGAGPRGSVRWSDGARAAGACARVSVLQERFSLEVGVAALPARGSDVYVALGFSDLNGALFWLVGR